MSEDHGDRGKTGAFFLGMLVGMLLAGGAAGTFFVTQSLRQSMRAQDAMMQAEQARAEAEMLRARAEAEAARRNTKSAE
jgi:hypothetical protein